MCLDAMLSTTHCLIEFDIHTCTILELNVISLSSRFYPCLPAWGNGLKCPMSFSLLSYCEFFSIGLLPSADLQAINLGKETSLLDKFSSLVTDSSHFCSIAILKIYIYLPIPLLNFC